ncbi:MAG: tetratricopeptide repeat protein [Hyphomicrobium sp.]
MTEAPAEVLNVEKQSAVRAQLERILKSGAFSQSQRRQRFLEYIVAETLAGRGDRLKGYAIAVEVFERAEDFDPNIDPIVRVEAGRLRDKLREYYETGGREDSVRIELPKGSYVPTIEFRHEAAAASDGQQPDAQPFDPRLPVAAALFALIFVVGAVTAWKWPTHAVPPPIQKSSIAVLPFKNIGTDPTWDRFADGLTEDVITDLAHSKDLFVIARNSTETYKGKPADIRAVGRDLGVRYVLEGSIQPNGEQIRVTAQLINADSGGHVWSARYDRPVADLFNVQSEVTEKIAATLITAEGAVAEAERSLLRRKPPANLTAFDTYLLAMEAKHKVTKESLAEAERLFNKAIDLDPKLARAHYGLATVQMYRIDLGLAPSVDEALAKMLANAEKSVELDPEDGNSHLALGGAYGYARKADQSIAELNKAEALSPSDADLLLVIAWSLPAFGETARAVDLAERSLKLNPRYPDWYNQGLSLVFFFGEQFDKTIKYRLLVKQPFALDYAFLAMANAYLGRTGDAIAAAANVAKADPAWSAERYLSDFGGFADKEAELFVGGARKAGLSACVAADALKDAPNLIRVKSCDAQRAKSSG